MASQIISRFRRSSLYGAGAETLVFSILNSAFRFGKSIVVAVLYGVGVQTDVFYAAQNFLFTPTSLLASSLNAMVIPAYQAAKEKGNFAYSYLLGMFIPLAVFACIFVLFGKEASSIVFSGFTTDAKMLLWKMLLVFSPLILLMPIKALFDSLYRAEKILIYGNMGRLLNTVISLLLLILFSGLNVFGLAYASMGGIVIEASILVFFFLRQFQFHGRLELAESLRLITKSFPVLFGGLLAIASLYFERYLASFLPPGTITLHSMALGVIDILRTVFVGSLVGAFYPFISELVVAGKKDEFYSLLSRMKEMIFGVLGLLMVASCSLSSPLFVFVYGHGKFDALSAIRLSQQYNILSFSIIYAASGNINSFLYYSKFETKLQQIVNLAVAIITGYLQWVLLANLGLKALAIGAEVALGISLLLDYILLKWKFGYKIYEAKDIVAMAISLIIAIVCGFARWEPWFLIIPILYYIGITKYLYGLNIGKILRLLAPPRKIGNGRMP